MPSFEFRIVLSPDRVPMQSIQCPSCNSLVPIPKSVPPGESMVCPRCDNRIASSRSEPSNANPIDRNAVLDGELRDRRARRQSRAVWSMRRTFVFGIALGLLGLTVGIVWNFLHRRDVPDTIPEDAVRAVTPWELGGLGYLPPDVDAVFAVHCASLVSEMNLRGWGQTPDELRRLGLPDGLLDYPKKLAGLELTDLHHLVVGVRWSRRSLPPEVVVILRTRKPYSLDALTAGMRTASFRNARDLDLRTVENPSIGLPLVWWPVNDRTLIVTLDAADLKDVPAKALPDSDHLSEDMRTRIRNKLAPDTLVWLVARGDKLAEAAAPLKSFGLLEGREAAVRLLGRLRGVSAGIALREETQWTTFAETDTAETAKEWVARIRETAEKASLRIQTGQPGSVCYFKVLLGGDEVEKWKGLLSAAKTGVLPVEDSRAR